MGVGLVFKVPGAIFKTILLMALFLTIASGSQAPCDDVNQTCEQQWNLMAEVDDGSALAYDSNGEYLAGEQSAFNTETVAFGYLNLNRSSSAVVQRVVTGNDTAQFIKLTANDVNNDLLSYTVVGLPSHGNISGTGPNIIYVPEEGYVGNDSIVIAVDDGTGHLQNITVSIDVLLLYHPPSVRIRRPMNGEIFTADPLTGVALVPIRATSTGDIVGGIQFYDGLTHLGGDFCEIGAADCAVTFIASLLIGPHTLTARATDSNGKTCSSLPVVITVNPPEPMVEITSPLAGEIFTAPADITITADVTDSRPVRSVEFFANSKSLGKARETESPYSVVWHDAMPGVYKLVAKASDRLVSAYSESVLVVVVPAKPLSKSNLAITKTCSPNPVPAGGLLNYVITVTNRGPDSASDVTVEDFLPSEMSFVSQKASQGKYKNATGLWNVGGLTKYRSAKLVLTVRAPSVATAGQIYNTAYVYGAQYDPDNSNNHAVTYTKIKARAGVEEQNSTEIDPSG
ncbi:MAG: Ig-like domain-containing protein [Methanothrix sp.]|nr:Ig-like domain-containing protein [Methanothrix sp.]